MRLFNNIRSLRWLVGILFTLNILLISVLWIIPKPMDKNYRHIRHSKHYYDVIGKFLTRKLDLTDQQEKTFKLEMNRHFETMSDVSQRHLELKRSMIDLAIEQQQIDYVLLDSLTTQWGMLEKEKLMLMAKHYEQLRKELLPEQKEKLKEILKKIKKRRMSDREDDDHHDHDH